MKILTSFFILAVLIFPTSSVFALPITYEIKGNFGTIEHQVGTSISLANNSFMKIQFTITDPTEILSSDLFSNFGNFSIASAFVTAPAFGLSKVKATDTNLDLFLFDDGSLEQFGFHKTNIITPYSYEFVTLFANEIGLDFIDNPNNTTKLNKKVKNLNLITHGWQIGFPGGLGGLNLEGGTVLGFYNGVSNAEIKSVPEPSSFFLLGSGLVGIALMRKKLKR